MRICGDESAEAGVVRSAHNEPARPLAGARTARLPAATTLKTLYANMFH